jgi:hypothetical protein
MGVGIQLTGNNASKSFIGISSGACYRVGVRSPPLGFIDSPIHLRSRECMLPVVVLETRDGFDSRRAFVRDEFDDRTLFDFSRFGPFCGMKGFGQPNSLADVS